MGRQMGRDVTPGRGERLKLERLRREVSRAEMARFMEHESNTLWYWETGKRPCPKYAEICYQAYFDKYNKQP
jgi:transcriptional regulator with XRE-family HTH domain